MHSTGIQRTAQQQTVSIRVSNSLREFLERTKDVITRDRGESVSMSDVARILLESARDDLMDSRFEVADLQQDPTQRYRALYLLPPLLRTRSVRRVSGLVQTLIQDVGAVQNDTASIGLAISDLGDIGGVSFPAGSLLANATVFPRAFIRPDGGTMSDLNTLVTGNTELYLFTACSINRREEIIGLAFDPQGNLHGYLATPINGLGDPLDEIAAATRAARFGHAWELVRERLGRGLTQQLNSR